ncbi:DUF4262 domain-containing protein [Streptomyces sp. NPDC059193]|uniref:DUF4262 domain-containing protein n=1 Tax=Streptomyces sp. NPDC059193 TaxID=3346763 RepID=UPI0036AEBD75
MSSSAHGALLASHVLRAQGIIASSGYVVQPVLGDRRSAPFSYTVGLHELHGYELVMVGADNQVMNGLIHSLVERFADSAGPDPEVLLDGFLVGGFGLRMRLVQSLEPFSLLRAVYGPDVCPPIWQAVWPDPEGRFPGDAGYSMARAQPLL